MRAVSLERIPSSLRDALDTACRLAGLDQRDAHLIHHYANAVFLLPAENAVARVVRSTQRSGSAQVAVEVTRWATGNHGFPATRPLRDLPAVPVADDVVVTFWAYYPQPAAAAAVTSADLAVLIRRLHDLPAPPVDLPLWRPLMSLEATVRRAPTSSWFSGEDRELVLERIDQVRAGLAALEWPLGQGLIHGDAWAGNLLLDSTHDPARVLLGDWDGVAYGPREIDLAPTWHAASRYGRGQEWVDRFVEIYGYDLAGWAGNEWLMRMRDLMQLTGPLRRASPGNAFEAALRQRLDGIRSGRPAVWRPLTGT